MGQRLACILSVLAACADPAHMGGAESGDRTESGGGETAPETRADEVSSSNAATSSTSSTTTDDPASTSTSEADTADCPGLPGDPGLTEHTIAVGSAMRTYLLYVPEALDPERAAPLVFVHHGASMAGADMHAVTGFADVADEEGFVVAFPDGTTSIAPWYVGDGVCPPGNLANGNGDDTAFVDAMIDEIAASQCIDQDRVFVTGFSMGGYFSNHVGCVHSDRIRAVAPHSGGTYVGSCRGGPVPVLLLHGTSDGLIGLQCGVQARDEWVARNGCSAEFDIVPVKGGGCQKHRDCPPGGQVTMCNFDGMGHGWAGGSGTYGGGTSYESATQLVWDFFAEQ